MCAAFEQVTELAVREEGEPGAVAVLLAEVQTFELQNYIGRIFLIHSILF